MPHRRRQARRPCHFQFAPTPAFGGLGARAAAHLPVSATGCAIHIPVHAVGAVRNACSRHRAPFSHRQFVDVAPCPPQGDTTPRSDLAVFSSSLRSIRFMLAAQRTVSRSCRSCTSSAPTPTSGFSFLLSTGWPLLSTGGGVTFLTPFVVPSRPCK